MLRQRLETEDTVTVVQQNRLKCYGHVLRKDDEEWAKNVQLLRLKSQVWYGIVGFNVPRDTV